MQASRVNRETSEDKWRATEHTTKVKPDSDAMKTLRSQGSDDDMLDRGLAKSHSKRFKMVGPHNKKSKLFGSTDFQLSSHKDKEKAAARLAALQVDNTKAGVQRRQAEEVKRAEKQTGLGVYPVPVAVDAKVNKSSTMSKAGDAGDSPLPQLPKGFKNKQL